MQCVFFHAFLQSFLRSFQLHVVSIGGIYESMDRNGMTQYEPAEITFRQIYFVFRRQSAEEAKQADQQQTEQFDPYDPESRVVNPYDPEHMRIGNNPDHRGIVTSPDDIIKTTPHYEIQSATLDSRRDVDILKQTCPYGTTGRVMTTFYPVPGRTQTFESPKFV